jgi:tRNA(His) guanylyltransferase
MKVYEREATSRISGVPMIVRLDGVNFSSGTKHLTKPFSIPFLNAMDDTAWELKNYSRANLVFTQSDEITLIFLPNKKTTEIEFFGGKLQKAVSILAAKASLLFAEYGSNLDMNALFDGRGFSVPSLMEASNAVYSRFLDGKRNSIGMLAGSLFSHKAVEGRSTEQRVIMCRDVGVDWNNLMPRIKYGKLFYKDKITSSDLSTLDSEGRVGEWFLPDEKETNQIESGN